MPIDAEASGDSGTSKAAKDSAGAAGPARSLGRGLEEVSHLFLSARKEPVAHPGVGDPAARPAARPPVRAGVAVLRRSSGLTKEQLAATLFECQDALESGMRALDANVPCGPLGAIDLLALDRANRLTVIEVDVFSTDSQLARGLSHVDWVVRNAATVQHVYRSAANTPFDLANQPRLVLVAPLFVPVVRSAIRAIASPAISCFRYHEVAISGGPGIFIEPVLDEE